MIINDVSINADLVDILQELKHQLDVKQISLLRVMQGTPDNIMVCCPYHKSGQERRPSAGIRKRDGIFHCFACGETHTLPEVVSYCFGNRGDVVGLSGWNWILKNFAIVDVESRKPIDLDFSRGSFNKCGSAGYVTDEELDLYRVYHPYMWKRRMTKEIVALFDIGYDSKNASLTFPVRERGGNTLFIARRSVNSKFFQYPEGVEKPVYGLYELETLEKYPDEVIICESMIDAITVWVYGKYAVALNGLGNDLQFKQLRAMPCRKFILATDNDVAGRSARKRIRERLRGKLITEYILPVGKKDINDLTKDEFDTLEEVF